MIKKILFTLFLVNLVSHLSAETVAYKLKGDLNSIGSESIEVSATPLIDDKEIVKSKDQIINV